MNHYCACGEGPPTHKGLHLWMLDWVVYSKVRGLFHVFRSSVRTDVVERKALHLVRLFLAHGPCPFHCSVVTRPNRPVACTGYLESIGGSTQGNMISLCASTAGLRT
jgi:hypothetical protein